jgi:hypothetical protein
LIGRLPSMSVEAVVADEVCGDRSCHRLRSTSLFVYARHKITLRKSQDVSRRTLSARDIQSDGCAWLISTNICRRYELEGEDFAWMENAFIAIRAPAATRQQNDNIFRENSLLVRSPPQIASPRNAITPSPMHYDCRRHISCRIGTIMMCRAVQQNPLGMQLCPWCGICPDEIAYRSDW